MGRVCGPYKRLIGPGERLSGEWPFGDSDTCPQASEGGRMNTEVLKKILTVGFETDVTGIAVHNRKDDTTQHD